MAGVIIPLDGWGAGTWDAESFGENPINFTGTTSVGSVTTSADANVNVTGVSATVQEGTVSFEIRASVEVTGVAGTTQLGTESVTGDANFSVTGVAGTSAVGSVSNTAGAIASPSGVAGTTQLGQAEMVETWTGWSSGPWGRGTWGKPVILAVVSGVSATTGLGSTTQTGDANVAVSGVEASALVPLGGSTFSADGNAQLSTAQAKFGPSSLLLDGTDDFVVSDENIDLSSGDFTVDLWIRPDNVTGYKGVWQSGTSTTAQSYLLGNQVYWTVTPSTIITSSVTVNANEWTMLSYERQGNTHRIYKNGTLEDTASTANKQDNGPFSVGKNGFGDFDGYIDEVRLSSVARYEGSSFTEPTANYAVDGNTTALLHFDGTNGSTTIVNETEGGVTITADANVAVTGLAGTTALGQADVNADSNTSVTGVEATGQEGTVTTRTVNNVFVSGVAGTGQLGQASIIGEANVYVTGVQGTGQTQTFTLVWGEIDTSQTPNWTRIAA